MILTPIHRSFQERYPAEKWAQIRAMLLNHQTWLMNAPGTPLLHGEAGGPGPARLD